LITEKDLKRKSYKAQIKEESQKYRTLSRRIFSGIIDGGLCIIPASIFILFFGIKKISGRYIIVVLLIQALSTIYNTIAVWRYGTTVGKKLLGLEIIRSKDENKPKILNSVLRELLNMLNLLVYIGLFVFTVVQRDMALGDKIIRSQERYALWGYISIIMMVITYSELVTAVFSLKRRAVHDFIGGTVVVKTEKTNVLNKNTVIVVIASLAVWFIYLRLYVLMN
jgi:uncharacterized RDD family membrane protein YckC